MLRRRQKAKGSAFVLVVRAEQSDITTDRTGWAANVVLNGSWKQNRGTIGHTARSLLGTARLPKNGARLDAGGRIELLYNIADVLDQGNRVRLVVQCDSQCALVLVVVVVAKELVVIVLLRKLLDVLLFRIRADQNGVVIIVVWKGREGVFFGTVIIERGHIIRAEGVATAVVLHKFRRFLSVFLGQRGGTRREHIDLALQTAVLGLELSNALAWLDMVPRKRNRRVLHRGKALAMLQLSLRH